MKCFGYWIWPFSNHHIVEKIHGDKNINVFFQVEGTFIKENKDENFINSPIESYKLRVFNDLFLYDLVICYNEIDILHLQMLSDDVNYKKILDRMVYVPYIPKNIDISNDYKSIDVLTLYTNTSINSPYRPRRKIFLTELKNQKFTSLNLSNVNTEKELSEYFAKSKIIVHYFQSELYCNHAEISLLPAICHNLIAVSEKPAITTFQYSHFIKWSDKNTMESVIEKIYDVLENYEKYYTSQLKELPPILKNMENKAILELQNVKFT